MEYTTSQLAKIIGVHPNTIRFYEEMNLLPKVERKKNGYRIFKDIHLKQLYLIKSGFRTPIVCSGLRNEIINIIKTSAKGNIKESKELLEKYMDHLKYEKSNAEEAVEIIKNLIQNKIEYKEEIVIGRKNAANIIGISIDVLRDWERNGLIDISKNIHGDKIFSNENIEMLKIIKVLRNANYSKMAILKMINKLNETERKIIELNVDDENMLYVTDRYIDSLENAYNDSKEVKNILDEMENLP